jgi:hypothetical protein
MKRCKNTYCYCLDHANVEADGVAEIIQAAHGVRNEANRSAVYVAYLRRAEVDLDAAAAILEAVHGFENEENRFKVYTHYLQNQPDVVPGLTTTVMEEMEKSEDGAAKLAEIKQSYSGSKGPKSARK